MTRVREGEGAAGGERAGEEGREGGRKGRKDGGRERGERRGGKVGMQGHEGGWEARRGETLETHGTLTPFVYVRRTFINGRHWIFAALSNNHPRGCLAAKMTAIENVFWVNHFKKEPNKLKKVRSVAIALLIVISTAYQNPETLVID